jgi:putative addiction module component (TIGR02574 family)
MSSQRSDKVSEGDRSPPSLARADLPRLVLPFTIRSEEKQMTLEQVLFEISSLTPSEQLKIAQVIWDRLPDEFGTDISPAQQAELDRRWIEYKKDPSSALTLEEFRERMRVARGK